MNHENEEEPTKVAGPTSDERRAFLQTYLVGALAWTGSGVRPGAGSCSPPTERRATSRAEFPVRYCLNTSTIHGEAIDLPTQLEIAAKAGYQGIELWLGDVRKWLAAGGSAAELRQRIADCGLILESAIAFAAWISDDDKVRRNGLEQAAQDMALVTSLGGTRIAAPPAGATEGGKLNLEQAGERYAALLEIGRGIGCLPMLEVWGFSQNLSRLSEVLYVCAASHDPDACLLPDVYHLYKGGSAFCELGLVSGSRMPVFHVNDYPAAPPREAIQDSDRVYPTDGVAPLTEILKTLRDNGFRGALSLELFNREYWGQDPLVVAQTGLQKMTSAVAAVPAGS